MQVFVPLKELYIDIKLFSECDASCIYFDRGIHRVHKSKTMFLYHWIMMGKWVPGKQVKTRQRIIKEEVVDRRFLMEVKKVSNKSHVGGFSCHSLGSAHSHIVPYKLRWIVYVGSAGFSRC